MGMHGWATGAGIRRASILLVLALVTACTQIIRNHGYVPRDDELSQIAVGVDTRESVTTLIGPPTSGGVLNESGFYYVASQFRHYGPLEPKEISREVLAINFDAAGTVSNISRYGLADGRVVVLSRRVTQDNVRDTTLIRQLLGNIGRFNPGDFIGDGT